MTAIALNAWNWSSKRLQQRLAWIALAAIIVTAISWYSEDARVIVLGALADAYIQVSAFVALTLTLFYGLEKWLGVDAGAFLQRNQRWQVPIAAFLGALPGCGGAIVVVTQYVQGQISFGAVLAVLTATMGDAAFLLLAQDLGTGLSIFSLGFILGALTGMIVDRIHGPDFLRQSLRPAPPTAAAANSGRRPYVDHLNPLWITLIIPGVIIATLSAFQIDVDAYLTNALVEQPTLWLGVVGSLLCVGMWAVTPAESLSQNVAPTAGCMTGECRPMPGSTISRVVGDTNFVTGWVVLAFLTYELSLHASGVNLKAVFQVWGPVVPLIGILLGLLPGCGPQVLVTTLYLNGIIPMSAQLGNTISNDGDALFPAIALAPKVALIATLYSAVPALIVGYGYWALFE